MILNTAWVLLSISDYSKHNAVTQLTAYGVKLCGWCSYPQSACQQVPETEECTAGTGCITVPANNDGNDYHHHQMLINILFLLVIVIKIYHDYVTVIINA